MNFLSARILDGSRWIELNDHVKYVVEGSSFSESNNTWRRQTVESPWIGGRFLVNAVKDVVEESLIIYVYGGSQVDLQDNIDLLVEAFSQFDYILEFVTDENRLQYSCECADYSVNRPRELLHNNMAIVSLRVPRIPEFDRIVDY